MLDALVEDKRNWLNHVVWYRRKYAPGKFSPKGMGDRYHNFLLYHAARMILPQIEELRSREPETEPVKGHSTESQAAYLEWVEREAGFKRQEDYAAELLVAGFLAFKNDQVVHIKRIAVAWAWINEYVAATTSEQKEEILERFHVQ
jgi:hypothetical protein